MKVLIIGSGGREHALAWKMAQSAGLKKLYVAPGNAGTASIAENIALNIADVSALIQFAKEKEIDLTVVGPEAPLVAGIVDSFKSVGLTIFGPTRLGAQLEGSKYFAKAFLLENKIPTAAFQAFRNAENALNYLQNTVFPCVIKADGLAAGKGVVIAENIAAAEATVKKMMINKELGKAGETIVIEQFLAGEEASLLAITDGETIVALPPSQDHKRVYDNDEGPNTGGMGAYAPAPVITPAILRQVQETILEPTLKGLQQRRIVYRGVIFVGLMLVGQTPYVLEYNCRFGDPETQVILPLLEDDFLDLTLAVSRGEKLAQRRISWRKQFALSVVLASQGYPGPIEKGKLITGLDQLHERKDVFVFHAGTALDSTGRIVTNGGRVLNVTAWADSFEQARQSAYAAVNQISFEGCMHRSDIGHRALAHLTS